MYSKTFKRTARRHPWKAAACFIGPFFLFGSFLKCPCARLLKWTFPGGCQSALGHLSRPHPFKQCTGFSPVYFFNYKPFCNYTGNPPVYLVNPSLFLCTTGIIVELFQLIRFYIEKSIWCKGIIPVYPYMHPPSSVVPRLVEHPPSTVPRGIEPEEKQHHLEILLGSKSPDKARLSGQFC